MKTHGEPDHLNWTAWQLLCEWLTEHRGMVESYEAFLADPVYAVCVDQWMKEQGWNQFTWRAEAGG